jgi:hypothetical protein
MTQSQRDVSLNAAEISIKICAEGLPRSDTRHRADAFSFVHTVRQGSGKDAFIIFKR